MSAVGEVLADLARVFHARSVDWYVFGAQAIAVRGAPRATMDVDVTLSVERHRIPALLEELGTEGFVHRFPDRKDELLRAGAVLPLSHVATGMEVDLVVAGSGLEALTLSRATLETIDGVRVPVASGTDLVVMKVVAGRGKDLEDVRALLAGDDVDVDEVRDLLGQLEDALGQSDLLPPFEAALRQARSR